jgi:TonB family protein
LSSRDASISEIVTSGDENALRAQLARGTDVNQANRGGQTPLILAIVSGHLRLLRLLLDAGADPLLQDNTGLNAIEWANRKGLPYIAKILSGRSQGTLVDQPGSRLRDEPPKKFAERAAATPGVTEPTRGKSLSPDEKSRRWIAGLKQRLDEKASRESTLPDVSAPTSTSPTDRLVAQVEAPAEQIAAPSPPQRFTEPTAPVWPPERAAQTTEDKPLSPPQRFTEPTAPVSSPARAAQTTEDKPTWPPQRFTEPTAPVSPTPRAGQTTEDKPTSPPDQALQSRETSVVADRIVQQESIELSISKLEEMKAIEAASSEATATSSSQTSSLPSLGRKRCPQCNTIYNSDLLAYCAYHIVALVDIDAPVAVPQERDRKTLLLWILIMLTFAGAVFTAYLVFSPLNEVDKKISTPAFGQTERSVHKGIPVVSGGMKTKVMDLPAAETTSNIAAKRETVVVRVMVDRTGHVYAATSSHEDETLRRAALEAARKATFSVEKLRAREIEGTISYTFNP